MGLHTVGGGGLEVVAEVLDRLGPVGGERGPTHAGHHQLGGAVLGTQEGAEVGIGGDGLHAADVIGDRRRAEVTGDLSNVGDVGFGEAALEGADDDGKWKSVG